MLVLIQIRQQIQELFFIVFNIEGIGLFFNLFTIFPRKLLMDLNEEQSGIFMIYIYIYVEFGAA